MRLAEVAHLKERLDPGLSGRALGHDEDPDGLDGTVSGLGAASRSTAQCRPGRFDGVERIGLAAAALLLSVRSIDFDHLDARSAQVASQTRAIRAGALHTDLGDFSEGLEPFQQRPVASAIGGKALGPEQPSQRIEGRRHMDVAMGIDTPVIPRTASTMVMVIPFSQRCEGWHGRSGSERRGSGLLTQPGPITPTLRRDVPFSMCGWKVSVDPVFQRHGTPSQTEPASTPEAIWDQQSSGGSSEKYQCTGTPTLPAGPSLQPAAFSL